MIYVMKAEEVRIVDQYLISQGQDIMSLIDLAGNAFFNHVRHFNHPLILCGFGNNGADALKVANLFLEMGIEADIYAYKKDLMNDNCRILAEPLELLDSIEEWELKNYDVIIDGLFGAGLDRPLEDDLASVIDIVNQSECPRISIDIPSGIGGNGDVYGTYFHCDSVVTFMALKPVYLIPELVPYYHQVILECLQVPDEVFEHLHIPCLISEDMITGRMKTRHYDDYKNRNGVIVQATGSSQYIGASIMAAKAAVYSGSGIVQVCSDDKVADALHLALPEVIACSNDQLPALHSDAYLVGCGSTKSESTYQKLEYLLSNSKVPVVVDADGLNVLSEHMELLENAGCPVILTPHLGEYKRLDPDQDIQAFIEKYHCILVLKGPNTLITDGTHSYKNTTGNHAMSTAGMGDALAGLITSFLGQGYSPMDACMMGVYIHGLAGDELAKNAYTVLPTQLIEHLPHVMKSLEEKNQAISA